MPEAVKHIKQAEHNEELLTHLLEVNKQSRFSDWYITVAFYTALHYIESVIFTKRVPILIKMLA